MDSTVTPTSPKSPQGFTLAEVEGDDARVGRLLREPAHQPDAMSALGEIPPSLGKRVSRDLARFLIVFSIGVAASLVWQWYGDSARAMWPELASLAQPYLASLTLEPARAAPEPTARATVSPELQRLKEDLAQLKQELQQLKGMPAALASLRQSVDRLAGSQQQIVGTTAKLSTQKPASPPRPAPAPAPKSLTPPQAEVR
jgi:hypothetical protein